MRHKALVVLALLIPACQQSPSESPEDVQSRLHQSSEDKRPARTKMLDEATVICHNGTAYLVGDDHDTYSSGGSSSGGPFVTQYIVNGIPMKCDGNSVVPTSSSGRTEP